MHSRSTLARLALLATLVGAVAMGGCGGLGAIPGRVEQPLLVSKRQIDRYAPGSPERTVLEWWRALQFNSAPAAFTYYAPSAGVTEKRLDRQLTELGPGTLGLRSRLRVDGVMRHGQGATVLAILTRALRHPNGRIDLNRRTQSFELVRVHGGWRLADNSYIDNILRYVKLAEANREKKNKK
jgi:hypothetical protein